MDHDSLQFELKNAPSLRLLRSDTAPLVISFLYHQFKLAHRITVPYPRLLENLEDYLEMLNEGQPGRYPRPAQSYLDLWCDSEHQFLRKYYEAGSDDPVFELTTHTEKVIGWLEDLSATDQFVGTESRFLRIFSLLEEIAVKSTEDAEARLAQLEKQKAAIQAEIEAIKETGQVELYTGTQIKERFLEANNTARRLLADFREVEQNFRTITRDLQAQQLKEGTRKGSLVAYVLDADEALKESDQGRSFYAFWEFLRSPSKQDELRALLDQVYVLSDLEGVQTDDQVLRRIKTSLIEAGSKIIQSNQRLAEQLRRLLDEQYLAESRRVQALSAEIKKLALAVVDNPPEPGPFLRLAGDPVVSLPMTRPLWDVPDEINFQNETLSLGGQDLGQADLGLLYSQFYVNESQLRQQIDRLLLHQPQVTLAEVTGAYPVQKGLSEILTYLALAARDQKHQINERGSETILLYPDEGETETIIRLNLPEVIFRR